VRAESKNGESDKKYAEPGRSAEEANRDGGRGDETGEDRRHARLQLTRELFGLEDAADAEEQPAAEVRQIRP